MRVGNSKSYACMQAMKPGQEGGFACPIPQFINRLIVIKCIRGQLERFLQASALALNRFNVPRGCGRKWV
jgi:hypothetical protein